MQHLTEQPSPIVSSPMPATASTRRTKKNPPKASKREAAIRARSSVSNSVSRVTTATSGPAIGRGRAGKKPISVYMHPLAKDLLAQISKDQSKSIQELGIEALNLLFTKYKHKPVA